MGSDFLASKDGAGSIVERKPGERAFLHFAEDCLGSGTLVILLAEASLGMNNTLLSSLLRDGSLAALA
jgi:hypothetical protein